MRKPTSLSKLRPRQPFRLTLTAINFVVAVVVFSFALAMHLGVFDRFLLARFA